MTKWVRMSGNDTLCKGLYRERESGIAPSV